MAKQNVRGHCPRSCGETLFVDDSGYILCSNPECPQPDAAHKLLSKGKQFLAFIRDDAKAYANQTLPITGTMDQSEETST